MSTRPRRARLAILVSVALLLGLSGVLPAGAAPDEGLFVFQSDRGGQVDLWTSAPDGSGAARLTDDKTEDVFAEWSPSGRKIAWTRGGLGPDGELWVMNADGTGRRQVTHDAFPEFDVVWSPDSSRLAFQSLRNGNRDIYAINADGTGERRLTSDPGADIAPDWAPDGSRIAFSNRHGVDSIAIFTMRPDGSDLRQLTPDYLNAGAARYSPDGSRLVFADNFCNACGQSDLWVINTDGSGLRQVTSTDLNEIPEAWSHDGTRVVVDYARLTGGTLSKADIAVVTVATGATVNVTGTNGVDEAHPDWRK